MVWPVFEFLVALIYSWKSSQAASQTAGSPFFIPLVFFFFFNPFVHLLSKFLFHIDYLSGLVVNTRAVSVVLSKSRYGP